MEYKTPLTIEMFNKLVEDLHNIPKRTSWTTYMNGKMFKELYPHLADNIDDHSTYIVEIPFTFNNKLMEIRVDKTGRTPQVGDTIVFGERTPRRLVIATIIKFTKRGNPSVESESIRNNYTWRRNPRRTQGVMGDFVIL